MSLENIAPSWLPVVVDFWKFANPQSKRVLVSTYLISSVASLNTTHIRRIPSFSANVTSVFCDSSVYPVLPPLQYS